MKKILATLAILAASTGAASAQDWAFEIYAGKALEGTLEYRTTDYDLDPGTAFGVGVYNQANPAFEYGLDLMKTSRTYTGFDNDVDSLSAVAVIRFPIVKTGQTTVYAGVGAGVVQVSYVGTGGDEPYSGSDVVPAAQASVGAQVGLGGGSALFAEAKYQKAVKNASIDSDADSDVNQEFNGASVLFGFRQDF